MSALATEKKDYLSSVAFFCLSNVGQLLQVFRLVLTKMQSDDFRSRCYRYYFSRTKPTAGQGGTYNQQLASMSPSHRELSIV